MKKINIEKQTQEPGTPINKPVGTINAETSRATVQPPSSMLNTSLANQTPIVGLRTERTMSDGRCDGVKVPVTGGVANVRNLTERVIPIDESPSTSAEGRNRERNAALEAELLNRVTHQRTEAKPPRPHPIPKTRDTWTVELLIGS